VHIDRAGARVEARPGQPAVYALEGGVSYSTLGKPLFYDYDGDGEPEILLATAHKEHEGGYEAAAVVATFKDGAVRALAGLPARYEAFEDIDADGRPDVLYFPYATDVGGPCSGFPGHQPGPAFVAHALPGGRFSLDDTIARAHVAAQCPTGSARDGGPEPMAAELCVLLRTGSEAKAAAALDAQCKRPGPRDDGCAPRPGVCFDYDERRQVLSTPPPFRLAP
jgi:hypothetical protein